MSDDNRVFMVASPKTKTETKTQGFQDQDQDSRGSRPRLVKTGFDKSRDHDSSLENSKCGVQCQISAADRRVMTRDGPKFGRHRSSAEEFGGMFGSVRLSNMRLFSRSQPNFGKHSASFVASHLRRFVLTAGVN